MSRMVFVDTETTGLLFHRHDVWEIAVIERRCNGEAGWGPDVEHVFHLRPDLTRADATALRVNRYYERSTALDAWTPGLPGRGWQPAREVARTLARLLDGAHLVGSNPAFDVMFLQRLLFLQGEAATWNYDLVDVRALALGFLHGRGAVRNSADGLLNETSQDIADAIGVARTDREAVHTALGDARWARDVYDAVTGRAPGAPS
ncbi:MAG: hypothetical protein JWP11_2819 [Frankiales bacterium]|nr:hypothetical protein [Frankiales bacterium]